MKRLIDLAREQPVCLDGHQRVRRFDADLVIGKGESLQDLHMAQGRFDQRLGCRLAELFLQILFKRTGIYADSQRDPSLTCCFHDRTNPVLAPNVARIDAQTVGAEFGHSQCNPVIKMDVGHQRNLNLRADLSVV